MSKADFSCPNGPSSWGSDVLLVACAVSILVGAVTGQDRLSLGLAALALGVVRAVLNARDRR